MRRRTPAATTAPTAATAAVATATAVAGGLLASVMLTGCVGGGALSGGTAAVLDGRRIPVGAVEARVAQLRPAATGGSADARGQADGLARRAVAELVLDAVVARALADRGLTVGAAEVAGARAVEELRYGGAGRFAAVLARRGIPEAGIDDYLRQQLGIRRLAAASGQDAGTPAGDAAVRDGLARAAEGLRLRINPRYGSWDARQVVLLPDRPDWLTPAG